MKCTYPRLIQLRLNPQCTAGRPPAAGQISCQGHMGPVAQLSNSATATTHQALVTPGPTVPLPGQGPGPYFAFPFLLHPAPAAGQPQPSRRERTWLLEATDPTLQQAGPLCCTEMLRSTTLGWTYPVLKRQPAAPPGRFDRRRLQESESSEIRSGINYQRQNGAAVTGPLFSHTKSRFT